MRGFQKDLQKIYPNVSITGKADRDTEKALKKLNPNFDINKTPAKDIIDGLKGKLPPG